MTQRILCVLLFLVLAALPATAEEFQVNTYTTDDQYGPVVAADAYGNFVVVWTSRGSNGSDSSGFSIQGQRFDSIGAPVGGEFQVNTYTTDDQRWPAVAADADGDFVVVWRSYGSSGSDSSDSSVQGQRYDSAGVPVGGEFQVNTYTTDRQYWPAVAADADGDFVVMWRSSGSSGSDSSGFSIQGQRYDSTGASVGGEFQVNTYTTDRQYWPAVAADADGDFVVMWQSLGSSGSDSSGFSIQGQRYDSAGAPVGGESQVNTYTPHNQRWPAVAVDADGDFVVMWSSYGSSGSDTGGFSIQGQRYDSAGAPVGGEFQVNTYTPSDQRRPAVAAVADGEFVVVWQSLGSSGSDSHYQSVQGQRFDSAGVPVGSEFQVNTYTTDRQGLPRVAADADGDFVVVWQSLGSSGSDSSGFSIHGQRYNVGGGNPALTVTKTGTGSGTVTSNPAGINCGTTCSQVFSQGTVVDLSAAPAAGSTFAGWSGGGCFGTGGCAVTLNSNTTITATFNASGAPGSCVPDATTLCIDNSLNPGDRRFKVTVAFQTVQGGGRMGDALAIPLEVVGITKGGLFAFSDPGNPEILVKVLNFCSRSVSAFGVYHAPTTNFAYQLAVLDTLRNQTYVVSNPDRNVAPSVAEEQALATCP